MTSEQAEEALFGTQNQPLPFVSVQEWTTTKAVQVSIGQVYNLTLPEFPQSRSLSTLFSLSREQGLLYRDITHTTIKELEKDAEKTIRDRTLVLEGKAGIGNLINQQVREQIPST